MKLEVYLSESDIDRLINGESVYIKNQHGEIEIKQSPIKDAAAPTINRNNNIYNNAEIENIKRASSMMSDTFKLGY